MTAEEQRRLLVAATAHELFLRHGYARTTLDMIAAHSGEARSTICKQIGSKADVLAQVCALQERLLAGAVRRQRLEARARARRRAAGEPRRSWRSDQGLVTDDVERAVIRAVQDAVLRNASLARLEQVVDEACPVDGRPASDIARRWETARRRIVVRAVKRANQQPYRRRVDGLAAVLGARPYLDLVERCGWDNGSYERWLSEEVRARLAPRPRFG